MCLRCTSCSRSTWGCVWCTDRNICTSSELVSLCAVTAVTEPQVCLSRSPVFLILFLSLFFVSLFSFSFRFHRIVDVELVCYSHSVWSRGLDVTSTPPHSPYQSIYLFAFHFHFHVLSRQHLSYQLIINSLLFTPFLHAPPSLFEIEEGNSSYNKLFCL